MKLSDLDTAPGLDGATVTPIRTALQWLRTCINGPSTYWDREQYLAATAAHTEALLHLEQDPHVIQLTPAEIQSGGSRVKWAEGLIRQLPVTHEGRNSWLLNYEGGKNGATAAEALAYTPLPTAPRAREKLPDIAEVPRTEHEYPACSKPDPLDGVRLAVQNLLDAAMTARVVVTIERKANTDGSAFYEIGTRGMREDYQK